MNRILWPFAFLGLSAYVWHYNQTNTGSKLLFPLIDTIVPSTAGKPDEMGEASVWAFVTCAVLVGVYEAVQAWRFRHITGEIPEDP